MRSKVSVLLLISFFFAGFARSQSNELIIQGITGKLFLTHTVHPKDNWYSIGRLYNISPKVIAPFNNLTMDKPLSIGQQVEIPLTTLNFSQDGQKMAAESLIPVYHIIQEKEWMYRISVNHNKVPIANLEKWNNINGDQIKAGMHVIVGYLKVKTALSALASGDGGASLATVPPAPATGERAAAPVSAGTTGTKAVAKTEKPAVNAATSDDQDTKPVAQTGSSTGARSNTSVSTPAAAMVAPAVSVPSGSQGASQTGATGNSTTASSASTSATTAPAVVSKPAAEHHAALNFSGGYFKTDFSDGGKSISGVAGTFKSTSGWQDGKYYALMNNAPVGTIVKVTLPATGKSVYAKILGQLPDMKESVGLTIRISNAAASELGGGDGKMSVEVGY
jgi:LysM repeat protein